MNEKEIRKYYRQYLYRDPSEIDYKYIENREQLISSLVDTEEHEKVNKVLKMISSFTLPGIKYICSIGSSGYAYAARSNILTLLEMGFPITVEVKGMQNVSMDPNEDEKILYSLVNKKIDYKAVIHHYLPPNWEVEKGKINFGFYVIESNILPPNWNLKQMDYLFTPSVTNFQTFNLGCVFRTKIRTKVLSKIKGDKFMFYTIAEWSNRKSLEETITCFTETFKDENVILYIKTNRSPDIEYDNVIIDKSIMSEKEILELHARGDCYISLAKSEGTGIGACVACKFNNQLILSCIDGHMDYLANFHEVSTEFEEINMCDSFPEHGDCKEGKCKVFPWFVSGSKWRKPNLKEASRRMMEVYKGERKHSILIDENNEIKNIITSLIK